MGLVWLVSSAVAGALAGELLRDSSRAASSSSSSSSANRTSAGGSGSSGSLIAEQGGAKLLGRLPLHCRRHMAVQVREQRGVSVTEPLGINRNIAH